ncbi:hypothetical protein ACFLWN_03910 [Chloroflexota bacterium]
MKIDALVHYQLMGCDVNIGSAKVLAEMAEKELGVTSLMIDGYEWDQRRWNREDFEEKLTNFIDTCLIRKGVK